MKYVKTDKAPAAIGPYSQGEVAGGFVYVSGQIPLDPATGELVGGSIEEQTERVIANLKAILEAAGTDISKVVKTTCFLKDMGDFSRFNSVYEKHFVSKPARACVSAALPKDAAEEVEVIALAQDA